MPWNGRPEERGQRAGQDEGPQARSASCTASCRDSFSKTHPASTASASTSTPAPSAAANQKSVPTTAATASAPPAAPASPLPASGSAHAPPDRDPEDDADAPSRDATAAQEHPHQPTLQGDSGDPCSSALAASTEPTEACRGTPAIPRPSGIPTAYTWTCSQHFQPAPSASSPGPVESSTPTSGARPFLLGSFR